MQVTVMSVHNPVGDDKPLWVIRDGEKLKIEKVNSTIVTNYFTIYHCTINGEHVALGFDKNGWWIDDDDFSQDPFF